MKHIHLFFSALTLQIIPTAFAAGGITSSGPVGKELLHCQGGIQFSRDHLADVTLSVAPFMGEGLVANVIFSEETRIPPQRRKVEKKIDQRGTIFEGSKIDILVPNMQGPNRQPGDFKAFLSLSDFSPTAAILDCSKN